MTGSLIDSKSRRRLLASVAGVVFCLTGVSSGHSDPWGDIHPRVSVVDGRFAIVFNTSLPDRVSDYSDEKPVQRMIFEVDGRLFAPRHPLERRRSWQEMGPVGLYGREMRLGDSTVILQGNSSGRPDYLLKSADGKTTRVRLPWPKEIALHLFEDALVTAEGIAITGKELEPLKFYWFAHEETVEPFVLTIGTTACIYDFPVASNIAFAGGRFWVAFMRPEGSEDLKLALWSWKPGEKDGRVEILDSPAYWNSHLSMAAIGDRLCLAYHCEVPGSSDRHARIVTVFRKAE
jgi:hypothetical protein